MLIEMQFLVPDSAKLALAIGITHGLLDRKDHVSDRAVARAKLAAQVYGARFRPAAARSPAGNHWEFDQEPAEGTGVYQFHRVKSAIHFRLGPQIGNRA